MNHLFVPYEIALKLKEKGFDEPCFGYWYLTNQWDITYPQTSFKTWYTKKEVLAPLYQQVTDWFRSKHNIHTCIEFYASDSLDTYHYGIKTERDRFYVRHEKGLPTYEAAVQRSVEEMIKLVLDRTPSHGSDQDPTV
jgi:hypothetical protein